jgi:hypothetical protein
MHEIFAHTEFLCTLTMTNYLSALFSTLNSILSVTNLSRLECAKTQCARKPRAYDTSTSMEKHSAVNTVFTKYS